ncbi:pilus assembly protein PilF [Arsukibacterium ikkense]|uniref:Pilus assembly protein PilF n=1 Tax=Arsukibacterium ikkense TaxID=336831 RepID=A0A0M2VBX4_9GAMM|nr:type IV pilus biogenesis/stability protein PilW [Arsukibacterium ikkense]KKO47095.1 pilus assembly protein PilF [Arsukibacterium ikkense]
MQKFSLGLTLCAVLTLTACVSESTYVGSDRQVGQRNLDNSEAARTRISLGLNYLRRGDTTQAKYNLERAKMFAPNMPEVYNALAFYYQTVGENAQAEEAYKQALAKDSNNADAYNNYGAFLCQIGKYPEAEELLLKAISRPGYIRVAESYENLALCQLDQQGFGKAKTFLESSVSHNGTRISSLINLAALNYAMGDNVGAKTALQRIQRLGRVSARSTLLNYLVAEKQGDMATMKHAEQLLLSLYIDTPEARLLLQQRLLESEFEQLREQYKLSLMANIVLPNQASSAVVTPTAPGANPRLRVVRRKTSETELDNTAVAASQPAVPATTATTTAASSASRQAIAGSLALSQPAVDADALAVQQQAETEALVARQQAEQQVAADAAALAARQRVEQQAAADTAALVAASQQAEQQAAADAEALAASQLVLAAQPPVSLPAETPLTEPAAVTIAAPEQVVIEQAATDYAVTRQADSAAAPASDAYNDNDDTVTEYHVVQEGESLYAISVLHNIRLARLMQWNQLSPESVIKTGQKIWLTEVSDQQLQQPQPVARVAEYQQPAATTEPYHQVAAGETMFGISYRYNIRLERFMAWNNFTEQSKLQVGQQVLITDPANLIP